MKTKLIEFTTGSGEVVTVVASPYMSETDEKFASPGDSIKKVKKTIEETVSPCIQAITEVAQKIKASELSPSSFTIEFGVAFSGETGILVSKAAIEASINISITWEKS